MSNIIISDLEANLELDRKALSDVLGHVVHKRKDQLSRGYEGREPTPI
ncbi:MAG: hypothetical protein GY792_02430 [Gammaproteobacteria bacterium]|nr:hypothetical protein [Gammaproteobacteria bacterium]